MSLATAVPRTPSWIRPGRARPSGSSRWTPRGRSATGCTSTSPCPTTRPTRGCAPRSAPAAGWSTTPLPGRSGSSPTPRATRSASAPGPTGTSGTNRTSSAMPAGPGPASVSARAAATRASAPAWAYPGLVRLVSLLPSATEIVYSLGLGDDLVGVTFECDEPPAARSEKTIVVGGRDTRGMTAREIDGYVRAQLAAGADLYSLHARALADLRPDLILTQDLCRVCALPSGQVEDALGYLGCQADVLSLDPHSLDEVLDSILAVGQRTGVPERATRLVGELRARLARTATAVAGRRRPKVAVIEWVDPPFTAGHWIPDLVTAAGGEPVAARPGAPSVPVRSEERRVGKEWRC